MMARSALTRLRWWKRLSMMMLCSVITPMTRGATPPTSPTTSLSRRRTARRTSERAASSSMNKLLSTRQCKSAELLLLRTVMSRDLRFVEQNMNQNAGPSKRFTMLRMMLCLVLLRLRRNVKMKLLATQPTPSAPSGPRKSVLSRRNLLRNILLLLDVPKNQGKFVLQLDVDLRKEMRSVMTKHKLLFRMLLRNSVPLIHKEPASMSQSWSPNLNLRKNVLMFQKRSVQDPEPIQGR